MEIRYVHKKYMSRISFHAEKSQQSCLGTEISTSSSIAVYLVWESLFKIILFCYKYNFTLFIYIMKVRLYHPSLSWALTSQPNWTRKRTMSRCPAHMALCSAVMPSSFAALASRTCPAVRTTSSSSPSRLASSSRASGSNDTLRVTCLCLPEPPFRLPFFTRRVTTTSPTISYKFS